MGCYCYAKFKNFGKKMKTNLINQTANETEKVIAKTYYESDFYFVDDDEDLIWVYGENDCIAEVYICTGTENGIYVSIDLNPYFDINFENLQSELEDFLVCERDYDPFDLDVILSPFSGDMWKLNSSNL